MRAKPFKGEVKVGKQSGLRKFMRAARRDKLPPEMLNVIALAQQSAAKRWTKYLNSCPAKRHGS